MNFFRHLRSAVGAAALMGAAFAAHAGPILWLTDGSNRLATVDVATGTVSVVGNMGAFMSDIAFSPTGDLYGISFSNLYSIDKNTAAVSLIGSLGAVGGTANALVFRGDGTLFMSGSTLYTVNTATGATTSVGSGIGFQSAGDLAFVGGNLYMAASNNSLVQVNTSTGVGSSVGAIGFGGVFGLASPDNVALYGMANNDVISINVGTGLGTYVSTFTPALGFAAGSAFLTEAGATAVPEPSTLPLMGLALLAVAMARRRANRRS